jgi:hypothetical protein
MEIQTYPEEQVKSAGPWMNIAYQGFAAVVDSNFAGYPRPSNCKLSKIENKQPLVSALAPLATAMAADDSPRKAFWKKTDNAKLPGR